MSTSMESFVVAVLAPLLAAPDPSWRSAGTPRCDEVSLQRAADEESSGNELVELDVEGASARFRDARSHADLPGYAWNQAQAESALQHHADALALLIYARERRAMLPDDCRMHDVTRDDRDFSLALDERIEEVTKRLVTLDVEVKDSGGVRLCVAERGDDRAPKVLLPFPDSVARPRYLVVDRTIGLSPGAHSSEEQASCAWLPGNAELLVNPGRYCFALSSRDRGRFATIHTDLWKRSSPGGKPHTMQLGEADVVVRPGKAQAKWYEGVLVAFPGLVRTDVVSMRRLGPPSGAEKAGAIEQPQWLEGPRYCDDAGTQPLAVVAADTRYAFTLRPQRDERRYVRRVKELDKTPLGDRPKIYYRGTQPGLRPVDHVRTRVLVGVLVGLSVAIAIGLGVGLGVKPKRELRFEN